MSPRTMLFTTVTLLTLMVDQATKAWVVANLAVGDRGEVLAQRAAVFFEDLFDGFERNAPHQVQLTVHIASSVKEWCGYA